MYEAPITIIEDQLHNQIITDYENGIMKALIRYQIHVDKEELLKALQYDRGQYEKGYQDGLNADKWIHCEERLPEEMEEVLISRENSKLGTSIGYYNKVFGWYDQCLLRGVTDVVAWMPKPMEYKKEGAE